MSRLKDARALIQSNCYILVTDKKGVLSGDFKGFSGIMKLHSLRQLHEQTEKLLKKLQADKKPTRNKSTNKEK